MTREHFRVLVEEAIDTIPPRFAREVRNLAVIIEDRPTAALLQEMEMEPDDVLLGLYQGTPLTERAWGHGNALPDQITLFQQSIEEECAAERAEAAEDGVDAAEDEDDQEDAIVVAIGETLIHELGHYFGLSEEEIMDIEDRYWRGDAFDDDAAV